MRKKTTDSIVDDTSNLIANSLAVNEAPLMGFARFNLQASDLDHPAGVYEYSITLLDQGYSSTIIAGDLELEQNPEFSSVGVNYDGANVSTVLQAVLRDQVVIRVSVGPTLAPGEATFTLALEQKLLEMYAGLQAAGLTLTADDIADGTVNVMMTLEEREALATVMALLPLPVFGDIVTHDVDEFLPAAGIDADKIITGVLDNDRVPKVGELRGISFGIPDPTGGAEPDLYFQHDA